MIISLWMLLLHSNDYPSILTHSGCKKGLILRFSTYWMKQELLETGRSMIQVIRKYKMDQNPCLTTSYRYVIKLECFIIVLVYFHFI